MVAGPSPYPPGPNSNSPPNQAPPKANTQGRINGAFSFIGMSAFASNTTGQLPFASGMAHGSTDTVSAAEFEIQLEGASSLKPPI